MKPSHCCETLHSEQRDQNIQLIKEVKVDFLVAGPITAGASVNLAGNVMVRGGGGLQPLRKTKR